MLLAVEAVLRAKFPADLPSLSVKPGTWAIIPERSWIEYHPRLGWFHKKSHLAFMENPKGVKIPVTTNSQGLRGTQEYGAKKPSRFRIAIFGDSFTFGYGVRDEESFPAQLESIIAKSEVLNVGVPAFGLDQIYLAFKEFAPQYQPDLAIFTIYPEDFWRALRSYNDGGYGKPYFTLEADDSLKLHHVPVPEGKHFSVPQFPGALQRSLWERFFNRFALYRMGKKALSKFRKKIGLEDPDTEAEWLLGRKILEQAKYEAQKMGIRLMIVLAPPARWITGTDEPIRPSLLRFSEREQIEFLDLTPVFYEAASKASIDRYYLPQDRHWTVEGNRLAAEKIAEKIRTL